ILVAACWAVLGQCSAASPPQRAAPRSHPPCTPLAHRGCGKSAPGRHSVRATAPYLLLLLPAAPLAASAFLHCFRTAPATAIVTACNQVPPLVLDPGRRASLHRRAAPTPVPDTVFVPLPTAATASLTHRRTAAHSRSHAGTVPARRRWSAPTLRSTKPRSDARSSLLSVGPLSPRCKSRKPDCLLAPGAVGSPRSVARGAGSPHPVLSLLLPAAVVSPTDLAASAAPPPLRPAA